jgi:AcrR family transcriptional regulator
MLTSKQTRAQAKEDSRNRLLQAGIAVFTEHGYEDASVREICRRAEINIAMVRYHFGDKRGLYDEVIRHVADADARRELLRQAVTESATPEEALRTAIHTVFRRLIAQTGQSHVHLRLMLNELVNPSSVLTKDVEAAIRPLYDQFRTLVGNILELAVDDPHTRLCTHSVLGQMVHYVHARPLLTRLWPEMRMSPEQVEMIADHIADFSLASLQATRRKPVRARVSAGRKKSSTDPKSRK